MNSVPAVFLNMSQCRVLSSLCVVFLFFFLFLFSSSSPPPPNLYAMDYYAEFVCILFRGW